MAKVKEFSRCTPRSPQRLGVGPLMTELEGSTMPTRVQYPDTIEPLVQFIEETPPSEIVDRTLEKLRAGVPIKTMMTASALAVTRSADLPPGHHGGPLHPLAGMYAVLKLVDRLEGEDRFVPVLQHVALSNKHINDPATGPYQLLEFKPLDAEGGAMTAEEDLAQDGNGDVSRAARHRGDQGSLPQVRRPRREPQGGPLLPVAVEERSRDRGVRSADVGGHPEEHPG